MNILEILNILIHNLDSILLSILIIGLITMQWLLYGFKRIIEVGLDMSKSKKETDKPYPGYKPWY